MEPGSLDNMQIVIADADATHADLVERGVEVSDVQDLAWGRFVGFTDPDGNRWALQQLPDWSARTPTRERYAIGPSEARSGGPGLSCRP